MEAAYKSDLELMKAELEVANSALAKAEAAVETLTTANGDLTTAVETLTTEKDKLTAMVEKLRTEKETFRLSAISWREGKESCMEKLTTEKALTKEVKVALSNCTPTVMDSLIARNDSSTLSVWCKQSVETFRDR